MRISSLHFHFITELFWALPYLLKSLSDIVQDIMIISAITPLLPGTALTNGVRDIFRGDYMSGGAKMLEALLIAIFVAIGIGSGLVLGGKIFG